MPRGFTGDVRQTVLESTSQRGAWDPDSLLAVVSNGMDEGIQGNRVAILCGDGETGTWGRGGLSSTFLWIRASTLQPGPSGLCL